MNILFDYQAFEQQNIGGVSRLYSEISSYLRLLGVHTSLGVKESDNVYLKEYEHQLNIKPLHHTHNLFFKSKKRIIGQRTIANYLLSFLGHKNYALDFNRDYCIKLIKKQRFDIFEPTFFDPYFLTFLKDKPFTMEVHDMIPELFPQYFHSDDFQIINKKLLCPLAAHIHTPSQKTKDDLVNILNINPDKITVISRGKNTMPQPSNERPINNPYILFVGRRGGYKNFNKTLREFSIILQKEPDLHLICTGSEFTVDEQKEIHSLGLENNIHQMFASEEMLSTLYHHAEVFVFPSAYEGFGLPILEAWSCGCPTFLNNASCFPEVAGNAAVYFEIDRTGDLAEKIIAFMHSSDEDKQALVNKQNKRLKIYSWESTAQKLYQIYTSLV